jgi:TolB-like protein
MTGALIDVISKIQPLRVISRTSTVRYKGTNKSLPEIARELKADAVIEGSVLRSGNRVRINVELIDARQATVGRSMTENSRHSKAA